MFMGIVTPLCASSPGAYSSAPQLACGHLSQPFVVAYVEFRTLSNKFSAAKGLWNQKRSENQPTHSNFGRLGFLQCSRPLALKRESAFPRASLPQHRLSASIGAAARDEVAR
jgi:hypothetical protein